MDISNQYIQEEIAENLFAVYGIKKSEHYKAVQIEELRFSNRTYSTIRRRTRCRTAWDLLSYSQEELMRVKGCGKTMLSEVEDKLQELKNDEFQFENIVEGKPLIHINLSPQLISLIEKILYDKYVDISVLSDEERIVFTKISAALATVGEEICRAAYLMPDIIKPILVSLKNYHIVHDIIKARVDKLNQAFKEISQAWEIAPVYPLVMAYTSDKEDQNALLRDFKDIEYIYKINVCFESISAKESAYDRVLQFLKFLKSDIHDLAKNIINCVYKTDQQRTVLECRANGLTLESTTQFIGTTRERIRQIENRGLRTFNRLPERCKLLWFISAVLGGKLTIDENDFYNTLNIAPTDITAKIVFYLFCESFDESKYYFYNEELRVFILGENNSDNIQKAIDFLQDNMITIDKMQTIVKEICARENFSYELVKKIFESRYKLYGNMYFDKRLTISTMYDYIIEQFYPHGIKLYDDYEIEQFKNHVKNIFGDKKRFMSNRAIDARIAEIGVLCDRGTYIHKNFVNIPSEIIVEIHNFIKNSPRVSISYLELFEAFKEKLLMCSNVDNRYYLQGVLKLHLNGNYHFTRDYVSKSSEASMDHEIINFVSQRAEVSIAEIKAAFKGITEAMLLQIIARSPEIISIDNALYIHSNTLNIESGDYEISKLIDDNIAEMPVSSRKLFELMSIRFPDFLYRNSVNTHSKLFSILKYMFGDRYRFSRPYIAQKEQGNNITIINIIKDYFKDFEILAIDELIDYCSENQLRYLNLSGLITELDDTFLRKDSDELVNLSFIDLSDEKLETIKKLLCEDIAAKGYLSVYKMDTFMYYPDIGVQWNGWIMRSIAKRFFDDITVLDFPKSNNRALNGVFVDSNLEFEDYETFLKWLIKSEHSRSPFYSMDEIENWLINEGIINTKLPNFLNNYVYAEEFGKIIVM